MFNPLPNSIMLRFGPGVDARVILDLGEVMDLYHSAVLGFLFALRGAHDAGGAEKARELHDYIQEWVQRQLRIQEVGEP